MKKVIVIGDDSYIGRSFQEFVSGEHNGERSDKHSGKHDTANGMYDVANGKYDITMVSSRDRAWTNADFTGCDSVLHCAGIAHVSQKKSMEKMYFEVNCDLAVEVAEHAKAHGVGQFVFMSSMLVYGAVKEEITKTTPTIPDSFYGASKLAAEQKLQALTNPDFKVCIVRPPMVYGYGCKGNFQRLVKLAKILPVFPKVNNARSMIYIKNLCSFLSQAISDCSDGIHLPQNSEHVNTSELVRVIAKLYNKNIYMTRLFNPVIRLLVNSVPTINKLFGNLAYAYSHDNHEQTYSEVGFEEGIKEALFDMR